MSHLPSHMIDDIKWTWWQTKDLNPSQYAVNITLNLPKVFILTGKKSETCFVFKISTFCARLIHEL